MNSSYFQNPDHLAKSLSEDLSGKLSQEEILEIISMDLDEGLFGNFFKWVGGLFKNPKMKRELDKLGEQLFQTKVKIGNLKIQSDAAIEDYEQSLKDLEKVQKDKDPYAVAKSSFDEDILQTAYEDNIKRQVEQLEELERHLVDRMDAIGEEDERIAKYANKIKMDVMLRATEAAMRMADSETKRVLSKIKAVYQKNNQQINKDLEQSMKANEAAEQTYNDYPAAAKANAKKAIEWKEQYGRDIVKGGTAVGWARAHQLAKGEALSADVVSRMARFNRHRQNAEVAAEFKDEPWKDRGHVAWLIWGGTEGVDWAIEKMDQIRDQDTSESNKITNQNPHNTMGLRMKKVVSINEWLNEKANKYDYQVGDIIGNTVDGFDWKVIKLGNYVEVENTVTGKKKKTWHENMYKAQNESANEGVINELHADTYKNTVKVALQKGDSKGNALAVKALQSFGKEIAKELAGKSFEVKGSMNDVTKALYKGSSMSYINQALMTFTGEGSLIYNNTNVFGSDEVHFDMNVEFQLPDNWGGWSAPVKFAGYKDHKIPAIVQFSIKGGKVWVWFKAADTDLEFTRAGAREMAKLADTIVTAMDFPTKAKHNTIKQFDPMKPTNESVDEAKNFKVGDKWEWQNVEWDPKRKNNYNVIKKVEIIGVKPNGEVTARVDGDSQEFIIREPNKYLKKKVNEAKSNVRVISKKEWDKTHKDYKTVINGQKYKMEYDEARDATILAPVEVSESVEYTELDEAYVPSNIKDFAKRKGITSLVNTVAGWAEKVGKRISGGTAIGKDYGTLILDIKYQDSAIRINIEDETIELYDEPVRNFKEFKQVYNEYQAEDMNEARSINKIQKDFTAVTSKMKEVVDAWKAAEGAAKDKLLAELKALTNQKKALERELDEFVMGKDRGAELAMKEAYNAYEELDQLKDWMLKLGIKDIRTSKEFDGSEGGLWIPVDTESVDMPKIGGKAAFNYRGTGAAYKRGIAKKIADKAEAMGFWFEWADPETLFVWPIN